MTQKLVNLKRNLLIMIMTNIQRELNTLATNVVNTKIAQANLVTKTNFDNEVSSLDSKNAANKTKNESIENELQKTWLFFLFLQLINLAQKMVLKPV